MKKTGGDIGCGCMFFMALGGVVLFVVKLYIIVKVVKWIWYN